MKKGMFHRILPMFLVFSMMFSYVPIHAIENDASDKENLALGKTATASGYEAGTNFTADKAIDGRTDRLYLENGEMNLNKAGTSRWASAVDAVNPWITIDLGENKKFDEVVIEWERRNINNYKVEVSNDNSTWSKVYECTSKNEFKDVLDVGTQEGRFVKITVTNYSPTQEGSTISWNNFSIYEIEIYNNKGGEVTPPDYVVPNEGVNISLGKTATASSQETSTLTPNKAIDGIIDRKPLGQANSRWASAVSSDDQWLKVDLGQKTQFDNIIIEWERKNASKYRVQISTDDTNWADVYTATAVPTNSRDLIKLNNKVVGRYVRLYIDEHIANSEGVTWNNISVFELQLYNGTVPTPPQTVQDVANAIRLQTLSTEDTKLTMPTVPAGFEISFIGADYEEVIDYEMNIHKPLVNTEVTVNFEIKKGTEKAVSPALKVAVPGRFIVDGNAKPTVIPELREWAGRNGNFTISDTSKIVINPASEAELRTSMETFATDYKDVLGKEIEVVVSDSPNSGDFYFTLTNNYPELRTEGYYMEIDNTVAVEANEAQGAFLATRSILQILKQTSTTIPKGLVRDYPKYDVRGFMLDVGRQFHSLDYLYQIMKTMSWYKMNDFQVHLNDNYIWLARDYHDNPLDAYSGYRLESNDIGTNGKKLTSEDGSYSKQEFGKFIDDSKVYGVNIVPEIDSPGHALAFVKVHPEYAYGDGKGENGAMLNVTNPEVVNYIKGIFSEYTDGENPVFRDSTVHIGTDEFYGNAEQYRAYTDTMLKFMRDEKGRKTRLWGSLSSKNGSTPVTSKNIEMNIWNNGWANPQAMYNQGYELINTDDAWMYIVPGANYYRNYLDTQWLYNNYQVNKFSNGVIIPTGSPQMRGGMFALWNDMNDLAYKGITEYDNFDRIYPAIQVLGEKMWGEGKDKSYEEFRNLANKISYAPNTNLRYTVDSLSETVMEYDFTTTTGNTVTDKSGNGYNSTSLNNATIRNGSLKLNDSNSYLETPVENIGPNYTVTFSINRDVVSSNEEQILFESKNGQFKAVQKETGKVGFSREGHDYSFNYELPKGRWVDIEIIGRLNKTELYVDGEYIDEISTNSVVGHFGTFVFPLERIGSNKSSFKGELKSLKVMNIAITVLDKTLISQEQMTITASSEHPNVGSEGLASFAIDGDPTTIWHTNYNTVVSLPQSITLNLGGVYTIEKFTYLPRSNAGNGTITQYELQVSKNGTDFTKVSEGNWALDAVLKIVKFEPVEDVSHVKLIAKSGKGGFASAAELNVHKVKEEIVNPNPDVDKNALKVAIEYADEVVSNGGLDGVVPAVVAEFNEALNQAKDVYKNAEATEVDVDAAFKRLTNAIWMLEFKQGNKEALQAIVDAAKALVEKEYTAESWANLQEVIKVAEGVLADENAMQEEVEKTVTNLNDAIKALVKKNVNKGILQNLVDKVSGLNKDKYIQSTWTEFEKALVNANAVMANDDATQEEVDSAYNTLLRGYLNLRLIPDKSVLEDLINKVNGMDLSKYTKESVAKLNKELKNANKVLKDKEATQEQINAATRSLEVAFTSLDEKKDNNSGSNNNNKPDSGETESGKDNGGKLPNTGAVVSSFAVLLAGTLLVAGGTKILKGKKEE